MKFRLAVVFLISATMSFAGCSCDEEIGNGGDGGTFDGGGADTGDTGGGFDAGSDTNMGGDTNTGDSNTGDSFVPPDPMDRPTPNPEAFYEMDPPAMVCVPDGVTPPPPPTPPGGTLECPDDKNREGCPCANIGERVPCWPGLRANRNRGLCRDGVTTCEQFNEFEGAWGACEGFVLPTEGVTAGPGACNCFSQGQWDIANVSPCFINDGMGNFHAVSTFLDAAGNAQCPEPMIPPVPAPGSTFSPNSLTVDCEGQFELCFTIKSGDWENPMPSDCTVGRTCTSDWYGERGVEQMFPPLPSWAGADSACATRFQTAGGYAEMTVLGESAECEDISDGSGNEFVFQRLRYCPSTCNDDDPSNDGGFDCSTCTNGASGGF